VAVTGAVDQAVLAGTMAYTVWPLGRPAPAVCRFGQVKRPPWLLGPRTANLCCWTAPSATSRTGSGLPAAATAGRLLWVASGDDRFPPAWLSNLERQGSARPDRSTGRLVFLSDPNGGHRQLYSTHLDGGDCAGQKAPRNTTAFYAPTPPPTGARQAVYHAGRRHWRLDRGWPPTRVARASGTSQVTTAPAARGGPRVLTAADHLAS